ncbi:hypothetical protein E4U52_008309 [Claviceps spartinae]|nr:hypothetical protein E4U52_008309 [Claviceps spartinae]
MGIRARRSQARHDKVSPKEATPGSRALRPMVRARRLEVSRDEGGGGEAAMYAEYNNELYETGTDSRRHNQQLSVVKPNAKPATRQSGRLCSSIGGYFEGSCS